jgi:glycerophosphoryl diester phosphodiesterase
MQPRIHRQVLMHLLCFINSLIEFDVVSTKDHHLIIRHDVLLDGTTNILDLEQFKVLKRKNKIKTINFSKLININ